MTYELTLQEIRNKLAQDEQVVIYDDKPTYEQFRKLIDLTDAAPYWSEVNKGNIFNSSTDEIPFYRLIPKESKIASHIVYKKSKRNEYIVSLEHVPQW
jgi:hypothetical protein